MKAVRSRVAAMILLACAAGQVQAVYCPRILYDPSAFVKNTIMAEEGVAATASRAASIAKRMQQYQTQLDQLTKANGQLAALTATKHAQDLAGVQQLLASLQQLSGSVQQVKSRLTGRLDEVKALGLSWDKYIEYEQKRIQDNVKLAANRAAEEARVLDQVNRDFAAYQEAASRVPASVGMHEAMQKLNVQANAMIQQSAQLARVLAPSIAAPGSVTEIRQQRNERATRALNQMEQLQEFNRARTHSERRALNPANP
jgi:P-type conjugative transfer protein TrbJ